MKPVLEYRRLRAPTENGGVLFDPSLESSGTILDENTAEFAQVDYHFQETTFPDLVRSARDELLERARCYAQSYRDVPPAAQFPKRILLTGHQPELFHPGVWFKNFALSSLATRHDAIGINLIVDNDLVRRCSINVPAGSIEQPRSVAVAFDRDGDAIPYEERRCSDRTRFNTFGDRVTEILAPFVSEPIIQNWWPDVTRALDRTQLVGQSFAQARHQLERDYQLDRDRPLDGGAGPTTFDVPLSAVCDTSSFCVFAVHLLAHLHRFRREYNWSLADYRRVHRLRTPAQPVPDLSQQGEWIEAPFWVWSEKDPRRRRLFVQLFHRRILLTDRSRWQLELPISVDADASESVGRLMELRAEGRKIRPRALTTTLFARLLLGDLFLHGIGGAKYDQINDQIIAKFFGMKPPKYLTLTATLHLPVHLPRETDGNLRAINQLLRELRFHPERHVELDKMQEGRSLEEINRWIASKREWVARQLPRGHRRPRHLAIQRANQHLQRFLDPRRQEIMRLRQDSIAARRRTRILASRDYAFCLFPQEMLRNQLLELSEG